MGRPSSSGVTYGPKTRPPRMNGARRDASGNVGYTPSTGYGSYGDATIQTGSPVRYASAAAARRRSRPAEIAVVSWAAGCCPGARERAKDQPIVESRAPPITTADTASFVIRIGASFRFDTIMWPGSDIR